MVNRRQYWSINCSESWSILVTVATATVVLVNHENWLIHDDSPILAKSNVILAFFSNVMSTSREEYDGMGPQDVADQMLWSQPFPWFHGPIRLVGPTIAGDWNNLVLFASRIDSQAASY